MGLVLACVVRILHDDWLIRLGENRHDSVLKHLVAMLTNNDNNLDLYRAFVQLTQKLRILKKYIYERTLMNPAACYHLLFSYHIHVFIRSL